MAETQIDTQQSSAGGNAPEGDVQETVSQSATFDSKTFSAFLANSEFNEARFYLAGCEYEAVEVVSILLKIQSQIHGAETVNDFIDLVYEAGLYDALTSHQDSVTYMSRVLRGNIATKSDITPTTLLYDAGFISDAVLQSPDVRNVAKYYVVYAEEKGNVAAKDVLTIMSIFGISNEELKAYVLEEGKELVEQRRFSELGKLLKEYELSEDAIAESSFFDELSSAVSKLIVLQEFDETRYIFTDLKLSQEHERLIIKKGIAHAISLGKFKLARDIVGAAQLSEADSFSEVTEREINQGSVACLRRGLSREFTDFCETFALHRDTVYGFLDKEDIEACIKADMRIGAIDAVKELVKGVQLHHNTVRRYASDAILHCLSSGDVEVAASLLKSFKQGASKIKNIGIEALQVAYRMCDVTRVEAILELIPELKQSKNLKKVFNSILKQGFRPHLQKHFCDTFDFHYESEGKRNRAAEAGALFELNRNEVKNAEAVLASVGLPKEELLKLLVQMDEDALVDSADEIRRLTKDFGDLEKLYHKLVGSDQDSLVVTVIYKYFLNGDVMGADSLGDIFGLKPREVAGLGLDAVVELLSKHKFEEAEELIRYLEFKEDTELEKVSNDGIEELRAAFKFRDSCSTLGDVVAFFAEQNYYRSGIYGFSSLMSVRERARERIKRIAQARLKYTTSDILGGEQLHGIQYNGGTFFQKKGFTCGPAALRTVIHALSGADVGEEALVEILGTESEFGTPISSFTKVSKAIPELEVQVHVDGSFDELRELMDDGYVVILNHKPGTEPHYSVVRAISDHHILFQDTSSQSSSNAKVLNGIVWQGGYDEAQVSGGYVALKLKHSEEMTTIADLAATKEERENRRTSGQQRRIGFDAGYRDTFDDGRGSIV